MYIRCDAKKRMFELLPEHIPTCVMGAPKHIRTYAKEECIRVHMHHTLFLYSLLTILSKILIIYPPTQHF